MSTLLAAGAACAISLPVLAWLAWYDPKRLRSLRKRKARRSPRLAGVSALLPGLVLALGGLWPAFLVWLGGVTIAGWLLALALAGSTGGRTPRRDARR